MTASSAPAAADPSGCPGVDRRPVRSPGRWSPGQEAGDKPEGFMEKQKHQGLHLGSHAWKVFGEVLFGSFKKQPNLKPLAVFLFFKLVPVP